MTLPTLSDEDKRKLTNVIDEGVKTQQEIQDLKDGLKETVNSVAKELDMKPKVVNQAIRTAFKGNLNDVKEEVSDTEELLHQAKR